MLSTVLIGVLLEVLILRVILFISMDVVNKLELSTDSDQSDGSKSSDVQVLEVDGGDNCGKLS